MFLIKSVECVVTCGMKVPNVLVLSRMGELCGICCDRGRQVVDQCNVVKVNSLRNQEDTAHHVISDVQAEGSSSVVDKGCRVGSEGRHANIQHIVDLGWQGKGCGGKWRLLMLPDIVKFTLKGKRRDRGRKTMTVFLFLITLSFQILKCAATVQK